MIDNISNSIIGKLSRENIIPEENRDIYIYGLQLLIATILKVIGLFAIALSFGVVKEMIVFMLFFSSLRIQAGGVHAETFLKCFISTVILIFSSIFVTRLIAENHFLNFQLVSIVLSIIVVFKYAPVETENKPLSKEEKVIYRRRSIVTVLLGSTIILATARLNNSLIGLGNIASIALLTQSLTLISFPIKKQEN